MGSVLDLFGVLAPNVPWDDDMTGEQADAKALHDDFRAVAGDLLKTVSQYESEKTHPTEAAPTA